MLVQGPGSMPPSSYVCGRENNSGQWPTFDSARALPYGGATAEAALRSMEELVMGISSAATNMLSGAIAS